jgi:hypothetical protein
MLKVLMKTVLPPKGWSMRECRKKLEVETKKNCDLKQLSGNSSKRTKTTQEMKTMFDLHQSVSDVFPQYR